METRRTFTQLGPLPLACFLWAALLCFTAKQVLAQEPPPIPTLEAREALIKAHDVDFGAAGWESRGVHDEYDVTHYDVDLRLDIPARVITGEVEVQAVSLQAGLTEVALDLYTPMVVDAVTVDGAPAAYVHVGGVIRVTLGHALQTGEPFTVTCAYHGTPSYSLNPFRWNIHGNNVPMVLTYSEPYGAPAWWVCKDDPKDKATFAIHVTAPDTLSTVSNGVLTSVVQNGNGTATYNWTHSYPMSTYLFSIAVTNFQSWTDVYPALDGVRTMDVHYYAYPEDYNDARLDWSRNVAMMQYFASIFGEYPFLTEKYAIAEFAHPGAMEHQTCTSMGAGWLNGLNTNDYVVAHELSHSWVGDMITMRHYSHAWTKEGFATYCEALYFESLYGLTYYHTYMNSMNVLTYALRQLYNIQPPLDSAIYYKGAWVLHMVRHLIGDTAFFAGIRAYTNNPDLMYSVNDTEDLRDAFESTSGMDLDWFFDQWIYHPGYPRLAQVWTSAPAGGGFDVTLYLTQTQTTGPIFKVPIDIRIDTNQAREYFTIWDSLRTQSFTMHVQGTPTNLVIDPDNWLIKQVVSGADVADLGPRLSGGQVWSRPNPFRPATTIGFSVPQEGPARLRVFDAEGRLVRTLLDGPAVPGEHQVIWNGRTADGAPLPAGMYFFRLDHAQGTGTGRTVLVR